MRFLLLCVVVFSQISCYDSSFGERSDEGPAQSTTTTIRKLCDSYAGTTFPVTGDLILTGRISANDRGGNFYRMLSIEDNDAGLTLVVDVDQLHNDFPVGCSVTLRLKGLAVGCTFGVLQIGTMPTPGSSYATDYIPSKPALDVVLTRNAAPIQRPTATVAAIPDLTPERCGTLVCIEGIHYTPEALSPSMWAGYKCFTDDLGNIVYTYVREYADFADHAVPVGRCSLTGVLQYDTTGDGRFILKLRDADDCIL